MLHDVYSKFACSDIYLVCVCVCTVVLAVIAGVCCAFLLVPAPLYDDIELPTTTTKHEVELEHNVAYGHLN